MQHLAQLGTVTGQDLVLLKPIVGLAVLLAVCGAQGQVAVQIYADAQHGQAGQGGIAAHLFVQIVGADPVAPVQCGKIALLHQQSLFAAGHALQGHAARTLAQLCLLHGALGGMMDVAFWYHFAILFEALFILTAVDAGTRAARFMLQDLLGVVSPGLKRTDSLPANLLATALCVLAWGYFLHQGVVDPLGGINTLWPLFGIANQMLAGMALMLCAVVLFKMKRQRYAWVALVPTAWLLICTLTAGWQKAFSPDAKVGFLAIANKFQAMIDSGNIPSQYTESQLAQLVFNNRLDAGLTIFFMVVVVVLALFSIKTALAALKEPKPTAKETPYEPMPENVEEIVAQAKGAH